MGLARGAVALLLAESARRPLMGKIATLGKQTVYVKCHELAAQFDKFALAPPAALERSRARLDDDTLLRLLGFDQVHSLDFSDYEGATHLLDLNRPGVSPDLAGQYDVVLDSGTLEHLFHLPNALRNVVDLVKIGGRIITLATSSNHMDHGFYMFSPTLFRDFFAANRFAIETLYVVRYPLDVVNELWDVYDYEPKTWRDLQMGGLDDRSYAIWAVATKTAQSTGDAVPQQGYYTDAALTYAGATTIAAEDGATAATAVNRYAAPAPGAKELIRTALARIPGALPLARDLVGAMRRLGPRASGGNAKSANLTHRLRGQFIGRF